MVPTYGSGSGLPNGIPNMQDAGLPALDMSSYTVYEWMESDLGLGLTKPLEAKVYAMIYQASMHHRGYFQINQTEFCERLGVARKTVTRTLRSLVDAGLVMSMPLSVDGAGGGAIKGSSAYIVAQGPINAAVVSVMDAKKLKAARAWSKKAAGEPMPGYLASCAQPERRVINNQQVAPLGQNVPTDDTCYGDGIQPASRESVENTVGTKCPNGATCGNLEEPQLSPLGQNVPADGQKCPNGATCGNAESDICLPDTSTRGSVDKSPVGDFDQRIYIEEGVRKKEDVGIRESLEKDSLVSEPIRFVGRPASDPASFRSLTQAEHEQLASFLGHWPKDAGEGDAFEETSRAWSRVMDWGFTVEEVLAAAEAYLKDFYETHDVRADRGQMRFVMFPKSFLARPDGLRKWAALAGCKTHATAAKYEAASPRRSPDAKLSVRRVNGSHSVWAYRDRYGNLVPLGAASISMTEEQAVEFAARMEAESWDGQMRRAQ